MTKKTCLNDIKALDEMISSGEYDHSKITTMCGRYGLVAPEEPEESEETVFDEFESIAPVLRVLAKEHFYTDFTDRQYILKGGINTYWNGYKISNEDCDDAMLKDLLEQGMDARFFLKFPGMK